MTTTLPPEQIDSFASQPETADRPPRRAGRRARRAMLVGVPVLVLSAVAVLLFALMGSRGPDTISGTESAPFEIAVPAGWTAVPGHEVAALPGKPLAVVRREDGTGFLVVRRGGKAPPSLDSFARDLDREFKKRIPDFEKRTTRNVKIKAGDAFFYSYIRKEAGTVHSVVLIPGPEMTYVLNTIAKGGEDEVAKQLGQMIVSFER